MIWKVHIPLFDSALRYECRDMMHFIARHRGAKRLKNSLVVNLVIL